MDTSFDPVTFKPTHRNLKNRELYEVVTAAMECTNARVTDPPSLVVVYRNAQFLYCTRDAPEFDQKFVSLELIHARD